MNILVLNRGSSSLKCSLFAFTSFPEQFVKPLWERQVDWKNQEVRKDTLDSMLRSLHGEEIDVIGHRIVHGGDIYQESVVIDEKVKEAIRNLADLAPLHNLADLEGIELVEKLFPGKPQIAVFDTAFHQPLPEKTAVYPGPYRWFENRIKRYGFHGISYQYCSRRAAEVLQQDPRTLKMVICHLGSGASLAAIEGGKSIDTTMGFTPLEGLMMDTRSGSVDPGILLYLLKQKKMGVDELSKMLNDESGLLGLSGTSSDMRDILEKISLGDKRAELAFEVYIHRLATSIGAMAVSLGGMNALVFTGGIGEHVSLLRKKVCEKLAFLGIGIDDQKNDVPPAEDCDLSSEDSTVYILLIHTQEAFEIARECWNKGHS